MNRVTQLKNLVLYNRILNNKEQEINDLLPNFKDVIVPFTPLEPIIGYRNNIYLMIDFDEKNKNFRIGVQKKSFKMMLKQNIVHPFINFRKILEDNEDLSDNNIIRVKNLLYASNNSIIISELFEDFITKYQDILKKDMFRGFQIRESFVDKQKYFMIIIKLYFEDINAKSKEVWENLENKLIKLFEDKFNGNLKLASIYKQITYTNKESTNNDDYILIHKKYDLIQKIEDLYFKISPGAFFQINMNTAPKIYNIIKELYTNEIIKRGFRFKTIKILDICCGTGTIGLFLSDSCSKVYGFEINQNAINDCLFNAMINNKQNTCYIKGPVESTIFNIIETISDTDIIIPIINPPKRGLYQNVIDILNTNYNVIEFIIYVSCNPKSFKRDYQKLKDKYNISLIYLIDQFPLTSDSEMIVFLDKIK